MNAPRVVIRRYQSMGDYQRDAGSMAAAGWRVSAQSSSSTLSTAGATCLTLGFMVAVAGLVFWFPLILAGLVLIIVGAVSRQSTYTVTYQPG